MVVNIITIDRIVKILGKGTYGKVVECYDKVNKIHCAIKITRASSQYKTASKNELAILQAIKNCDQTNENHCAQLLECFEHNGHVCFVFELLGQSIFDCLRLNNYQPFPRHIIKAITKQLLVSISFLHANNIIHTDIKPENILLVNTDTTSIMNSLDATIQLIDFGSSIFANTRHPSLITTRHYRAPEVLLGLSWSYPCDIWSIGCTLIELFTGNNLFPMHEDTEHLVRMELLLGEIPPSFVQQAIPSDLINPHGKINYPNHKRKALSVKSLKSMISDDILFYDLISKMLMYDPNSRITAKAALSHPFLRL